jgi:hypothetical protein
MYQAKVNNTETYSDSQEVKMQLMSMQLDSWQVQNGLKRITIK